MKSSTVGNGNSHSYTSLTIEESPVLSSRAKTIHWQYIVVILFFFGAVAIVLYGQNFGGIRVRRMATDDELQQDLNEMHDEQERDQAEITRELVAEEVPSEINTDRREEIFERIKNYIINGRYKLKGTLGRGVQARVFKCQDNMHPEQEMVAVKVGFKDVKRGNNIDEEVRIVKSLSSIPEVPQILFNGHFEYKTNHRSYYLSFYGMPMLGENLRDVLVRTTTINGQLTGFSLFTTLILLFNVVTISESINRRGIVHNDLHYENILFGKEHTSKMYFIDFGLAEQIAYGSTAGNSKIATELLAILRQTENLLFLIETNNFIPEVFGRYKTCVQEETRRAENENQPFDFSKIYSVLETEIYRLKNDNDYKTPDEESFLRSYVGNLEEYVIAIGNRINK